MESNVGSGEFASFMIDGILVRPRTAASQPRSFNRPMIPAERDDRLWPEAQTGP